MQILASILAVAILYVCVSASLIDLLKGVHSSPAFKNLTHPEQILIIELLGEAEAGELKQYIDIVGLQKVLLVVDSLPEREAHLLTQMLVDELNKEEHAVTTAAPVKPVGRRDLAALLKRIEANQGFQHLSQEDQQLLEQLIKAADANTLDQLVQHVGYARVLEVFDALPEHETHQLTQYLVQHMSQSGN